MDFYCVCEYLNKNGKVYTVAFRNLCMVEKERCKENTIYWTHYLRSKAENSSFIQEHQRKTDDSFVLCLE